jgi:hypothetical protein
MARRRSNRHKVDEVEDGDVAMGIQGTWLVFMINFPSFTLYCDKADTSDEKDTNDAERNESASAYTPSR